MASPASIRIMTYNICSGVGNDRRMDYARTTAAIEKQKPDLVALQEISVRHHWLPDVDPFDVFCAPGNRKRFFAETLKFTVDGITFPYGIGVLGRDDVEFVGQVNLPIEDPKAEPRAALIVRVRQPFPFYFVCAHLASGIPRQLQTITEHLKRLRDLPAVLVGDFNVEPDKPCIAALRRDWEIVGDDTPTFHSKAPTRKIDYICVMPQGAFHAANYRVIPDPLTSDHLPVVVDLSPRA